jgi:hypothetical protein
VLGETDLVNAEGHVSYTRLLLKCKEWFVILLYFRFYGFMKRKVKSKAIRISYTLVSVRLTLKGFSSQLLLPCCPVTDRVISSESEPKVRTLISHVVTIDGVLDWILDLVTTLAHIS